MADATRQTKNNAAPAASAAQRKTEALQLSGLTATEAAVEYFKEYSRERPEIVTMWAFGLGFVLGWKLRIW